MRRRETWLASSLLSGTLFLSLLKTEKSTASGECASYKAYCITVEEYAYFEDSRLVQLCFIQNHPTQIIQHRLSFTFAQNIVQKEKKKYYNSKQLKKVIIEL
jgi:hypothetical protein